MSGSETRTDRMGEREPDEFEQQLTQALCHVDPPKGFAVRVLERTAPPARAATMRRRMAKLRGRAWIGGAIAAMLMLGVVVGDQVYVRHEREQAVLANRQFAMAMRVTNRALDQTRAQLKQAGLMLGN
jgi:hypothetical protein